MLTCFAEDAASSRPVHTVTASTFETWLAAAPSRWRAWLEGSGFAAESGGSATLPGDDGDVEAAVLVLSEPAEPWDVAALYGTLPDGDWRLAPAGGAIGAGGSAVGWALGAYRFDVYRTSKPVDRRLVLPDDTASRRGQHIAEGVQLARDLINTPANDMGPEELEQSVRTVALAFDAKLDVTIGDALLEANYPVIHAVGRASPREPRLIDLTWGDADAPKVTLVGKGVCFDTGGLDLKPSSNMLLMKKDMGGSAVMLGLARTIMAQELPVRLRLLIAAVENSVGGAAFRPGDVLTSRQGLTIEIGNTDAEGRLVLADALSEATARRPISSSMRPP